MMKDEVTGFKMWETFENKEEAFRFFEKVKENFTYCELKMTFIGEGYRHSESLKIFRK